MPGEDSGQHGRTSFRLGGAALGRITIDGEIREFPTRPDAEFLVVGGDGALWFSPEGLLGRMSLDGKDTYFPDQIHALASLTLGLDKNLWFADYGLGLIWRVTQEGASRAFMLPGGPDSDPTELVNCFGSSICFAGALGFGKIEADTVVMTCPRIRSAQGLVAGRDGTLWAGRPRRHQWNRCDPATGHVTSFAADAKVRSMAFGPDGNVWAATEGTFIDRFELDGTRTRFALPAGGDPVVVRAGPDGNVWVEQQSPGRIFRVSPSSGAVTGV